MVILFERHLHFFLGSILLSACGMTEQAPEEPRAVQKALSVEGEIAALGDGNWLVVAESAFPVISRHGVRTLVVDEDLPQVLDRVVKSLQYSDHVVPNFTVAGELDYLSNDRAPGIDQFRIEIREALNGHEPRRLDYRSLVQLLANRSEKLSVLVLKTKTSLPYTSVFIELASNYWDHENEADLRQRIDGQRRLQGIR